MASRDQPPEPSGDRDAVSGQGGGAEKSGTGSEIDRLVFECLERFEAEGEDALTAICAAHPEHAARLRGRIDTLRRAGLISAPEGARVEPFPERLGEFRLLESLGGGGMGVVYRATQESLGREVALKLIRPDHLYFPGSRERFRREVEAIARLQHPGIVPIYTVGEERGIPFFAMERVQGASLADVIKKFEGRRPADLRGSDLYEALPATNDDAPDNEVFAGTWTECALRIVRNTAEALEHAHRRGVLHRDLKPSNIMITRDGRVLLLDFGLASSDGADKLTRTGAQVGSLPYLTPEQVEGRTKDVDRRSDVYALGVALYELLTLHLPYRGDSTAEIYAKILAAKAPRIREQNAAVSFDAETVCLTAMESARERRYATAADFARDLSNVLERRPIEARRAHAGLRFLRWTQRHPAVATAAALGILLVAGVPTTLYLQQRAAGARIAAKNIELAAALKEAERQRDRAERNVSVALGAVYDTLGRMSDELSAIPHTEKLREDILNSSLAVIQNLAKRETQSTQVSMQIAATQIEIGLMLGHSGRGEEAVKELEGAIARTRKVLAAQPDDAYATLILAEGLDRLARVLRDLGRLDESTERMREAAQLLKTAKPSPGEKDCTVLQRRLIAEMFLASNEFYGGHVEAAIAAHADTVASARGLVACEPSALSEVTLAASLNGLGATLHQLHRDAPALEAFHEGVQVAEHALTHTDSPPDIHRTLVDLLVNLGNIHNDMGDHAAAEIDLKRALTLQEALARDFPENLDQGDSLCTVRLNLASAIAHDATRHAEALALLEANVALATELMSKEPDALDHRSMLALANGAIAAQLAAAGEQEKAIERYRLALADDLILSQKNGDNPFYRNAYNEHALNAAEIAVFAGGAAAALEQVLPVATSDSRFLRRCAQAALATAKLWREDMAWMSVDLKDTNVERWTNQAWTFLDLAVQRGFNDVPDLENSPTLAPLRTRAEWTDLVQRARANVR